MDNQININISAKDQIVMKLLHYFITDENYNPVVLHGAKNEIWLENMDAEYKIVRIVSNYIHNDEQLNFDLFKTKRIVSSIKKKTLKFNLPVLSIFTDLGEKVNLHDDKNINCVYIQEEEDLKKYRFIYNSFPDIDKKLKFTEKGVNLFMKITDDINQKNKKEALKVEQIFKPKVPIITYILIFLNIAVFIFCLVNNKENEFALNFANYGPAIRNGQFYRLITSAFLHVDFLHILFNMYALYIVGSKAESFFGKTKYIIIYFLSALTASLLSIVFSGNVPSIGASGAIFGVLGALLFFGMNFRVYLGNTLVAQIAPIIVINLIFGFMMTGVDNFAHIGGLIGGFLCAYALGLKSKSKAFDHINGTILTLLYMGFLIFMNFFYLK